MTTRLLSWLYLAGGMSIAMFLTADLWFDIDYRLAANISLICVTATVVAYTAIYALWSTWYVNRVGRVFLIKSVIFSLFLAEVTVAAWWDVYYPGRSHVRYALYTAAALAYVGMVIALLYEQRKPAEVLPIRVLMESAPDALFVVRGTNIVYASSKAAAATGYTVTELQSMPVEDLLPQNLRSRHAVLRSEYQKEPEARWMGQNRGDLRMRRADGSVRRVEAALFPANLAGQKMTIVWVRDITDRALNQYRNPDDDQV